MLERIADPESATYARRLGLALSTILIAGAFAFLAFAIVYGVIDCATYEERPVPAEVAP